MNNNLLLKKDLTAEELAMVQSEVNRKAKSKGIAYALWWFTGLIGGHRYYAGDIGIGIGMTLTGGGFGIWTLIDAFFIGKRIEEKNEELEYQVIQQVLSFHKSAV
ncbi:TM2 domain-containing protein [Shimazuella sp. AN120528]|uniref:TM2 domain-containing protein n=1 Tax=Shimazuella soli TaxID=1892854 RepID=UPI001F1022C0|nr:TM2 domain-containing protein [Shimazuella soli]MCH5584756.1 TM2 domain-containing protein [Shimazuella soli]